MPRNGYRPSGRPGSGLWKCDLGSADIWHSFGRYTHIFTDLTLYAP